MQKNNIFVSELSSSKHSFRNYHFCRGNNSKRKSRIGIIMKGCGTYIYLNKKLKVNEGDVVFIPENIYCYSEWRGEPEIEVIYVSCFIHYDSFSYEPQTIACDESTKEALMKISNLLSFDYLESLEAYSLFYKVLSDIFPKMKESDLLFNKTLQSAMEYISENWKDDFSVGEIAKKLCISESTLYHLFQKELGETPLHYLNSIRINVAMEYLENTNYSISTIIRLVRFNSENHFRKVFYDFVGTTPLKFRKSGNKPK